VDRETLQSLREKSSVFFSEKDVGEPRLSAELLLAHALRCQRLDLFTRFDQPITDEELERFRALVRRRLTGEPVQYIIESAEFYGLPFRVTPAVLIPRPETELLVEHALRAARERFPDMDIRILDIGAGSGCIAAALARHLPDATVHAVDSSAEAVAVARENIAALGLAERVVVEVMDILTVTPGGGPYHLVVSNPPYIPQADMAELQTEVRDFEPHAALSDSADGLTFHRRLVALAPALLDPRGLLLVEIGFGQSSDVTALCTSASLTVTDVFDDYAGIPRVVAAQPAAAS
jgi:release factor glutamine methyltransferase